jgi:hypothetical protein
LNDIIQTNKRIGSVAERRLRTSSLIEADFYAGSGCSVACGQRCVQLSRASRTFLKSSVGDTGLVMRYRSRSEMRFFSKISAV